MVHRGKRTAPRRRLGAVVVPTVLLAWVGLAMTTGMAAAVAAPATTAAAHGNGNGNGGVGNGNGNGNSAHAPAPADPTTTPGSSDHSGGTSGTSGDPTQPQPPSNADQNPGGANNGGDCGSYCSTRDGSPSGNGNGGGKATGKPCAGCVGKADNKNPPGQYKDGSDHNAGYECDRNHGIGRSNPAHTGCTTSTPPTCEDTNTCPCPEGQVMVNGQCETPGCPDGQVMNANGDCETPGCPDGQVMNADGDCETPGCPDGEVMSADGDCVPPDCVPSNANDCGNPPPDCVPTIANNFCSTVEGEHHHRHVTHQTTPPTVLGEKVVRTPSALPFTGLDVGLLVGSGAIALAAGAGLTVAGRRRRRS